MCISCRTRKEKRDLIRLVLDKKKVVQWDSHGDMPGRGAYVCKSWSCRERLGNHRILGRVFKREDPVGIRPELLAEEWLDDQSESAFTEYFRA